MAIFQSTLLMRGATKPLWHKGLKVIFQSTLLMRGATDLHDSLWMILTISIHAPHARSDVQSLCTQCLLVVFQSTLLMRGATVRSSRWVSYGYFNPRSSCEERLVSTNHTIENPIISIHAPHARSDKVKPIIIMGNIYFNPRSSCEERLAPVNNGAQTVLFQSTLLMRGATRLHRLRLRRRYFNPRSSCEERHSARRFRRGDVNFNPRSSCEERQRAAQGMR